MPFLLVEILNFQGSTHFIGVGSLSYLLKQTELKRTVKIVPVDDVVSILTFQCNEIEYAFLDRGCGGCH